MQPKLVTEETRAQVLRAVAEAGYTPNLLARGLGRREAGRHPGGGARHREPVLPEIIRGVEHAARGPRLQRADGQHRRRPGAGVGLSAAGAVAPGRRDDHADQAASPSWMTLLCGGCRSCWRPEPVPGHDLPVVRIDNRAAAAEITRHLVGLGHRRIAHVTGPLEQGLARARLEGWRAALVEQGLPAGDDLVAPGDFRVPLRRVAGRGLLARPDRPTAIFVASDESAMGVLSAIRAAGLRRARGHLGAPAAASHAHPA